MIAEKKKVQRSYGNHFPAMAATTIAEIEKILSQRSFSMRSLESGFLKLVYRVNNTRYNFQKNKLPFKHLKPQFIGRILLN